MLELAALVSWTEQALGEVVAIVDDAEYVDLTALLRTRRIVLSAGELIARDAAARRFLLQASTAGNTHLEARALEALSDAVAKTIVQRAKASAASRIFICVGDAPPTMQAEGLVRGAFATRPRILLAQITAGYCGRTGTTAHWPVNTNNDWSGQRCKPDQTSLYLTFGSSRSWTQMQSWRI